MLAQDLSGLVVGVLDEGPHLGVDGGRHLVGVVAAMPHVAAEERFAVLLAELLGAEGVGHAELGDHGPGDLSGPLDVVLGAGGGVAEDQLLGGAAPEQHGQLVAEL